MGQDVEKGDSASHPCGVIVLGVVWTPVLVIATSAARPARSRRVMREYIHGPTDLDEVARLEHQAVFIGERALRGFPAQAGDRVLDLGTGVGAMAAQLLRLFPGACVVGLDRQRSALQT